MARINNVLLKRLILPTGHSQSNELAISRTSDSTLKYYGLDNGHRSVKGVDGQHRKS